MANFDGNESWLKNNDTSNISINIKEHIKNGRHRAKYNISNDSIDKIDSNLQEYDGFDHIKALNTYLEENNLEKVEFSVFQCKTKSKIPAFYANIKLVNTSVASSFPEKCSHPDIAKQVAARNALVELKKTHSSNNIPVSQDMKVVAERLEKELQKNYAGLFCDKVEGIYKQVYNESLPENWLVRLNMFTTNIVIEDLPNQNKSILYYASSADIQKPSDLMDTSKKETYNQLPLMKFVDKTKRRVKVTNLDSNHQFWILFVHDSINNDYDTMFKLMNMPNESQHFHKMFSIEIFDVYAVQIENIWYRFQVTKIEDNSVTGNFIDLGMEWCVSKDNLMFLPEKFLKIPSQAIKCSLTSLFFASYFEIANDLFHKMLFNKEFTVIPDNIEGNVSLVTLYDGTCNINSTILDAIIEHTIFNKIDKTCKKANLSCISDGFLYIHPPSETLLIMESILDSISKTRPLDQLISKISISPEKLYLVKCQELDIWGRAKIGDFVFSEQNFNVYFIDYGNHSIADQSKFIDLQLLDPLLAKIGPQALKVSFNLFPPEIITLSQSKALHEMIINKSLDVEVVSTDGNGIQVVDIYDAEDQTEDRVSFNTQLYQSV